MYANKQLGNNEYKAPNPQLLPGPRNVGCPLLHLDGLIAENTFHSSLYSV